MDNNVPYVADIKDELKKSLSQRELQSSSDDIRLKKMYPVALHNFCIAMFYYNVETQSFFLYSVSLDILCREH